MADRKSSTPKKPKTARWQRIAMISMGRQWHRCGSTQHVIKPWTGSKEKVISQYLILLDLHERCLETLR